MFLNWRVRAGIAGVSLVVALAPGHAAGAGARAAFSASVAGRAERARRRGAAAVHVGGSQC